MLRFIVKRKMYNGCTDDTLSELETVDAECEPLEKVLRRGGHGGGPNGDDYDRTELFGVEIKSSSCPNPICNCGADPEHKFK